MKITAAVADSSSTKLTVETLRLDRLHPGEVLVRIVGSGICHTDLVARDGILPVPLPAVLGHEGSGIVEEIGEDVTHVTPGDHVVLTFDSCGACRECISNKAARCQYFVEYNFTASRPGRTNRLRRTAGEVNGSFFGQSSFASHAVASARNTIPVAKDVPLHLLGPLGCGIQTGAGSVLNALKCAAGTKIAIFGAGSVACSAVLAAVVVGCDEIIVVGRNPARLRLAGELGATRVISMNEAGGSPAAAIQEATGGGVDYSLETTANPNMLRHAVECLVPGGICGHVGAAAPGTEVSLDMSTLLFSRQVRGIVEGDSVPHSFIPALIELHREGRFPFDKIIAAYPFAEVNTAIEEASWRSKPKAVLTFENI